MGLGESIVFVQGAYTKAWEYLDHKLANGTLAVSTPQQTVNVDNPLATQINSYTVLTFYGQMGYKIQYSKEQGVIGGVVDSGKLRFVIPEASLGGLTYDSFRKLLQTTDVVIMLNQQGVNVLDTTQDVLTQTVVVTFGKLEGN